MKHSVPDSASSPNRYWWKPTSTCCSKTNWTVCGNTSRTRTIRKEVLENMIRQLTKDSFLEQENEKTNTYKVMSAWHYLERLIESINIYDETEDEKPE